MAPDPRRGMIVAAGRVAAIEPALWPAHRWRTGRRSRARSACRRRAARMGADQCRTGVVAERDAHVVGIDVAGSSAAASGRPRCAATTAPPRGSPPSSRTSPRRSQRYRPGSRRRRASWRAASAKPPAAVGLQPAQHRAVGRRGEVRIPAATAGRVGDVGDRSPASRPSGRNCDRPGPPAPGARSASVRATSLRCMPTLCRAGQVRSAIRDVLRHYCLLFAVTWGYGCADRRGVDPQ